MNSRHSIRTQIIVALNLVAVAVALVLGWQGVRTSANAIEKLVVEDSARSATRLIRTMNLPLSPHLMNQLALVLNSQVAAVSNRGEVIASSLHESDIRDLRDDWNAVVGGNKNRVEVGGERFRIALAEADENGAVLAILLPESRIRSAQRQATLGIVWTTLLVIAVVTIIAWWLGHRIARPINRLGARFRRLATFTAQARSASEAEEVISDWRRERTSPNQTGSYPVSTEMEELQASFDRLLNQVYTAYERLDCAARLAAGGRLSTAVAHELRNPLSGVKMIAQILRKREKLSERNRESIDLILDEVARMEDYLDSLGGVDSIRQRKTVEKEVLDMTELARQAMKGVAELAESKSVRLEVDVPEQAVEVQGEATGLRRLLQNLARNAVEASPSGTEVRMVVETHSGDVILRIFDTGPGVSSEVESTLFEPFVSTRQGGTGLGLFFCSRIVAAHGGELSYHRNNETTEFRVVL
jgi:signal transduction histidine kinase